MAASTSNFSPFPSPPPSGPMIITDQEFNAFHNIDRVLYSRLILTLGRDPAESMQVMALWLWLERSGPRILQLVKNILALSNALTDTLAEETVSCLTCIESDNVKFDLERDEVYIPLLRCLLKREISLRFFHENRIGVLRGVTKIVNEVCARAFADILRDSFSTNPIFAVSDQGTDIYRPVNNTIGVPFYPGIGVFSHAAGAGYGGCSTGSTASTVGQVQHEDGLLIDHEPTVSIRAYDPYDLAVQRQFLTNELGDLLGGIGLSDDHDKEEREIPPDDRTIFLTFSKGYPISENEVREFFNSKFGDCIEAVYMQEVPPEEQVLYARLVVRPASAIRVVLDSQSKAKFSINGKHVWARKYVRKNPKSPSQQPTSPVGELKS